MTKSTGNQRYNKFLIISLFLIIGILAAYWQVKNCDFVDYDDQLYVTENNQVQAGITVEGIIWAFTTFHAGNWNPITWLSHMLDCELYGLNPMGHHWTNLLFHMANTLLLFFIFQKMTGAIWKSAFVAALFALHPLHVESVAWVAERKDVLSTFFGFLMIIAYYRYVKKPHIANYLIIILFLCLGLMAKPMLVTMPFVLLLLDLWPIKRLKLPLLKQATGFQASNLLAMIREKIPLLAIAAIFSVLTIVAQQYVGAVYPIQVLPLKARISNAFVSYITYIIKAIWPHKLAVFYPHPFSSLPLWHVLGAALLIACSVLLAVLVSKKYPYITVGLFWFLGTLVPVIGLIQVGSQAMADRYTYIPLTGIFIILAWGGSDLLKKWTRKNLVPALIAIAVLSLLTMRSFQQITHWKNSITLFKNALTVTDNNPYSHNNIGIHLTNAGRYEEAIHHYKEALKIKPNYVEALFNLGTALYDTGKTDEAILYLNKVLTTNPDHAHSHNNLASILFLRGKVDEAIFHYKEVIRIDPEYADAHSNLANALRFQEKFDEAIFHFKKALEINPRHADAHYNFGILLINKHKLKEAVVHFAEAIKINPDYKKAYNQIGIILLQHGKIEKAEKFLSKAVQIDPEYSEALKNLKILNQIKE